MKESSTAAPENPARARRRQERVAWIAGTRGEFLLLGPLLRPLKKESPVDGPLHFLFDTGEQGMATQQALDALGLRPDETAPLLHPADEASVRLQQILERIEAFTRQRKATHLIFTGYNATAAAAALLCHTRSAQGLWLRPADPARVISRLDLESGYRRLIESVTPRVASMEIGFDLASDSGNEANIPGRRKDAGIGMIAVLRREWGMRRDITGLLVRRAAQWARRHPQLDWLFLSNLNARLESPFRSIKDRPANLLIAPPLPCPDYRGLLNNARLMLTDSPLFASEAIGMGIPLATFGETSAAEKQTGITALVPEDLSRDDLFDEILGGKTALPTSAKPDSNQARLQIKDWILGGQ